MIMSQFAAELYPRSYRPLLLAAPGVSERPTSSCGLWQQWAEMEMIAGRKRQRSDLLSEYIDPAEESHMVLRVKLKKPPPSCDTEEGDKKPAARPCSLQRVTTSAFGSRTRFDSPRKVKSFVETSNEEPYLVTENEWHATTSQSPPTIKRRLSRQKASAVLRSPDQPIRVSSPQGQRSNVFRQETVIYRPSVESRNMTRDLPPKMIAGTFGENQRRRHDWGGRGKPLKTHSTPRNLGRGMEEPNEDVTNRVESGLSSLRLQKSEFHIFDNSQVRNAIDSGTAKAIRCIVCEAKLFAAPNATHILCTKCSTVWPVDLPGICEE